LKERIITAIGILAFLIIIAIINNFYLTGFVFAIIAIIGFYE